LLRQTSEAPAKHAVVPRGEVLAVAGALHERAKTAADHLDVADADVPATVTKTATDLGEFGFEHEPERPGVIL